MKTNKFFEVLKGWGKEIWFWNSDRYCYKHLYINKDRKCSYHYHRVKDEIFHCVTGPVTIKFSFGDDISQSETIVLKEDEVFHVPPLLRHQMIADHGRDVILVEISTTHDDNDSYRVIKGD